MKLMQHKNKWIVYGDDDRVIVICSNKLIAVKYAKEQANAS